MGAHASTLLLKVADVELQAHPDHRCNALTQMVQLLHTCITTQYHRQLEAEAANTPRTEVDGGEEEDDMDEEASWRVSLDFFERTVPMTSHMCEQKRTVIRALDGTASHSTTAFNVSNATVLHDMRAFRAGNPSKTLEEFCDWYYGGATVEGGPFRESLRSGWDGAFHGNSDDVAHNGGDRVRIDSPGAPRHGRQGRAEWRWIVGCAQLAQVQFTGVGACACGVSSTGKSTKRFFDHDEHAEKVLHYLETSNVTHITAEVWFVMCLLRALFP